MHVEQNALISYAVVAHQTRLTEAAQLAHTLGAVITLDDGSIGANRNHLRAWDITATLDSDWAAVLEDDAQPVDEFAEQAEQALSSAPEPVVSFYLGQTRPRRWQERIAPAIATAEDRQAHWLTTTHVLHAVAVAIRVELREDWLDFAATSPLPIDERLTAWCLTRDHKVAYTWPSLVDHADGPTLVHHTSINGPPPGPRRAWRTGTRPNWTPQAVTI